MSLWKFIELMKDAHPEILHAAGLVDEDTATMVIIKVGRQVGFIENPEGYLSVEEMLMNLWLFI